MRVIIAAVGERMPSWVDAAVSEYSKRLPKHLKLDVMEIPLGNRVKQPDVQKVMQDEGVRLHAVLPANSHRVALDGRGQLWSSEQLAQQLSRWQALGKPIALMIGGPDGHASSVLREAHQQWSLGPLTLPHPLVRIVLAEQIYRAASMLGNHPYHRA